jgi:hypothetical protein
MFLFLNFYGILVLIYSTKFTLYIYIYIYSFLLVSLKGVSCGKIGTSKIGQAFGWLAANNAGMWTNAEWGNWGRCHILTCSALAGCGSILQLREGFP